MVRIRYRNNFLDIKEISDRNERVIGMKSLP